MNIYLLVVRPGFITQISLSLLLIIVGPEQTRLYRPIEIAYSHLQEKVI